jgi:hypothetical protein
MAAGVTWRSLAGSVAETGDGPLDIEMAGWTVKQSEVNLAQLLQLMSHSPGWDFDEYLRQTNAVVVAD